MTDTDKAFREWHAENYSFAFSDPLKYRKQFWDAGVAYGRANPVLQPMDTAPKDGRFFDVWVEYGDQVHRFSDCFFHHEDEVFAFLDKTTLNEQMFSGLSILGWTPIPEVKNDR